MADQSSARPGASFVEREAELALLLDAAEKAEGGSSSVAFVTGTAGAGKSALLGELGRRLERRAETMSPPGALMVTGRCDALMPGRTTRGGVVPLQPFTTAAAQLTGPRGAQNADPSQLEAMVTSAPTSRRALWTVSIRMVKRTSPALFGWLFPPALLAAETIRFIHEERRSKEITAQLTAELEEQARRTYERPEPGEMVAQFVDVVAAISTDHPLVITIDDLHWADDASLDMFFHLGRCIHARSPELQVLLVAGFRPDEADDEHHLTEVISETSRYLEVCRIDLDETSARTARSFCDGLIDLRPNRLPVEFRELLAQRTNGNPLFVAELVRDLEERGSIIERDGVLELAHEPVAAELPERVQDVIANRLAHLDTDDRELLMAAAVQGYRFTAEAVAALTERERRDVIRALDRLRRDTRLVVDDDPPPGLDGMSGYRFAHALLAEFAYGELGPNYCRELHGIVAEFLADHASDTDLLADEIARHYETAGDDRAAAAWYLKAATMLRRRADWANTIAMATRGAQLASTLREPDREVQAECELAAAYAATQCDRLTEASRHAQDAIDHAEGLDPLIRARAVLRQAGIARRRGQYEESLRLLESQREVIGASTEGDAEADLQQQLGIAYGWLGRHSEALTANERVIAIGSLSRKRAAMNNMATLMSQSLGRLDEALVLLNSAVELADQAGNPGFIYHRNTALTLARMGLHSEAREAADRCRPHSTGSQAIEAIIAADAIDGYIALHANRSDLALEAFERFLSAIDGSGIERTGQVIACQSHLALCRLAAGDTEGARAAAERAVEIRGDRDATADREVGSPAIALAAAVLGDDPERAAVLLRDEHGYWGARQHRGYAADYNRFLCSAGVLVATGDRAAGVRAQQELDAALDRCDGRGLLELVTWMLSLLTRHDEVPARHVTRHLDAALRAAADPDMTLP